MDNRGYEQKVGQYVNERPVYDFISKRNRVRGQITTKMRTMMIGFIAQMEKYFGESWGHGLTDDECTDDQLDMKAVWKQLRETLLDFGNGKIREAEKEINSLNK